MKYKTLFKSASKRTELIWTCFRRRKMENDWISARSFLFRTEGFAGFSIDALRKTLDLLQEKPLQIKISDTCAKAFDESATIITGKIT